MFPSHWNSFFHSIFYQWVRPWLLFWIKGETCVKNWTKILGSVWSCFLKFVFKNYFLFFNLKKVFKNKFKKTWSNDLMFFFYFLKAGENNSYLFSKNCLYFTLFLKIISREQQSNGVGNFFLKKIFFVKIKIYF